MNGQSPSTLPPHRATGVSSPTRPIQASWYAFPQFYDLAFQGETPLEVAFIEAACRKYCGFPCRRLLEPACGSGRLVVALAKRGYRMTAFDRCTPALDYLRRQLRRRHLNARIFEADMTSFKLPRPVDAAYSAVSSFRHLLSEAAARSHLESVANNVRPGGIYVLAMHLVPPDADEECTERWTERQGSTQVTVTLRVLSTDRRRRLEQIRISLLARRPDCTLRVRDEFPLRLYTASQFRRLLARVPAWELCDVYDYWYDIEDPLRLTDELSDTVFILRRKR